MTRKQYVVTRAADGRIHATVMAEGATPYTLPHLMRHSPDGFEFGYAGSGPADLARSIVGDLQETDDPHPREYQAVKFALVATLDGDGPHIITDDQITETLEAAL